METIKSIKDEKINLARFLKSRKGRQEQQRMLPEGEEILNWALENGVRLEYLPASDRIASSINEKYCGRCWKVL